MERRSNRQMTPDWNRTEARFPSHLCLHELFEAQVEESPDRIAVVGEREQLTYARLNRRSNRLAHFLRGRGVGPDSMVGICVDRSVEMVVGMMAIAKAGGAYLPIDPAYPSERLTYLLADSGVSLLLSQSHLLGRIPASTCEPVCLDDLGRTISHESAENPRSRVDPENLAYVIYTSGSTGKPKGVLLNHRGRVNNFADFNRRYGIGQGDRLLAVSSPSFDMSAYDVFGSLACGATIVIPENAQMDPVQLAHKIVQEQVTVWHSVPALLGMVVDHVETRSELHPRSIRLALLGGDWIPLTLPDRLRAMCDDVHVVSMGGATEVSMDSTIFDIGSIEPGWKSIPYGVPMANQLAYVLDERMQPVSAGTPGELHLGGVGVGRGYLNQPALTAERFVPNPFSNRQGERLYKTGDLARFGEDGVLELLGRMDFQVKIRGFRVELGEIEAVLRSHPSVKECIVLDRPAPSGEKRLVAWMIPDSQDESLRQQFVSQWRSVYDDAYSRPHDGDPTFNINSWDSSYTNEPIPAPEMRDWQEQTVERIRRLQPERVLEIGCGTGLLLFSIAPSCLQYVGTDISAVALDFVQRQVAEARLSQVQLLRREANDFSGLEKASFDTIILNSVVLDFPGLDYLLEVLRGASELLSPGGSIFVGDVRNLGLQEAFAASVQLAQACPSTSIEHLQEKIRQQVVLDQKLVIDPAFFSMVGGQLPGITDVRIELKEARFLNELTRFRYDVTFSKGETRQSSAQWLDWRTAGKSLAGLRALLADRPECLAIERIPNARTFDAVLASDILRSSSPSSIEELVASVGEAVSAAAPVEPDELRRLGLEQDYLVEVRCPRAGEPAFFDAVFVRSEAGRAGHGVGPPTELDERPVSECSNTPIRNQLGRGPMLRDFLLRKLPDYMVPASFVVMDRFPLTPNGKLDRRALPDPTAQRPDLEVPFAPPQGPVEELVAGLWCEVLGLEQVGAEDSFLSLGGHSLAAVQVISRLNELLSLALPVRVLFGKRTVAQLARTIEAEGRKANLDIAEVAGVIRQIGSLSEAQAQAMLTEEPETTRASSDDAIEG